MTVQFICPLISDSNDSSEVLGSEFVLGGGFLFFSLNKVP